MSIVYNAEDFIGGGDALDGYDGADLVDGMKAAVFSPDSFAPYILDDDSGAGENSPQVISPDANPGTKRWILQEGIFAGLTSYGTITLPSTNKINFRDSDIFIGSAVDGTLDIGADVSVDFFYDNADVGDAVDGQKVCINRRAAEGDDYISLYVDKDRKGLIGFNGADDLLQLATTGLTVNGTLDLTGNFTISKSVPVIILDDTQGGGETWSIRTGVPAAGDFKIRGHGTDVVLITGTMVANSLVIDDGKAGFGIALPRAKIDVYGGAGVNTYMRLTSDDQWDGIIEFYENGVARNGKIHYDDSAKDFFISNVIASDDADLVLETRDTPRVTIKGSGAVIIAKAISSGTSTFSTAGPTDNVDVSGINTLFIDNSGNAVTIGGLAGGVDGQILHVTLINAGANNVTLEHNEAGATQKIFLHAGANETLNSEYGGWTLICHGGTDWHDCSHAKHV